MTHLCNVSKIVYKDFDGTFMTFFKALQRDLHNILVALQKVIEKTWTRFFLIIYMGLQTNELNKRLWLNFAS